MFLIFPSYQVSSILLDALALHYKNKCIAEQVSIFALFLYKNYNINVSILPVERFYFYIAHYKLYKTLGIPMWYIVYDFWEALEISPKALPLLRSFQRDYSFLHNRDSTTSTESNLAQLDGRSGLTALEFAKVN